MDKLLYLSMTGASQTMLAQAARANNLANVNTTGFKADFEQARAMPVFGDGYASRVYAMTERPATNQQEGMLNFTGRDLDVAMEGNGWLAVQTADGQEAYTRAGGLQITAAGTLVTGSGLPVLGEGGPIQLPPAAKVEIGMDGTLSVKVIGDEDSQLAVVDRLKLVLAEPKQLEKGLDGLMRGRDGEPLAADGEARLKTGYLEASNVNAVAELTAIIDLSRRFEMNIKMMTDAKENSEAAARVLQNLG